MTEEEKAEQLQRYVSLCNDKFTPLTDEDLVFLKDIVGTTDLLSNSLAKRSSAIMQMNNGLVNMAQAEIMALGELASSYFLLTCLVPRLLATIAALKPELEINVVDQSKEDLYERIVQVSNEIHNKVVNGDYNYIHVVNEELKQTL